MSDIKDTIELHEILQDIVYAQGMINRSVYRLNKILGSEPSEKEENDNERMERV